MAARACPEPTALRAYLLGKLPPGQVDRVAGHLDDCAACRGVADQFDSRDDALLQQLQAMPSESSAAVPPPGDDAVDMGDLLSWAKRLQPDGHAAGTSSDASPGGLSVIERIGDYDLLRVLGHGGYGTVYLGRGAMLGRLVAVKVLRPERADADARTRFLAEMRAVGHLRQHAHVVQAFHASEENGRLYLVMEYVQGRSLSRLLAKMSRLPVDAACECARQAALGLQHIFEHDLVHRDVKPANLMVSATGEVKLLDLGLARLTESLRDPRWANASHRIMGTFDYIAPEQTRDARAVDIRADIYGLGCSLYHLLAGSVPFPGDDPLAKLESHRSQTPVPLRKLRPELPAGLAAVVDQMMAKDPAARYATPGKAAAAIEPFCGRVDLMALLGPVPATPPQFVPPGRPRTRPWHRVVMSLCAALALGTLAMIGWLSLGPEEADAPPGTVIRLAELERSIWSLSVAPDGGLAVSEDGKHLQLWDLRRRAPLPLTAHGPEEFRHSNAIFSADGRAVIVGTNVSFQKSQLQWFDSANGTLIGTPIDQPRAVLALAANPRWLLTAENGGGVPGGRVRAWNAASREPVFEFLHPTDVRSLALAPDGRRFLSGCDDGIIRLWHLDAPQQAPQILEGHVTDDRAFVIAVGWSSDGGRAYSIAQGDQSLRGWDVNTGALVTTVSLSRDAKKVTCGAIAANGSRAVVAHDDGAVTVWELESGHCLLHDRKHNGTVTSVALSSNGLWALSAGGIKHEILLTRLPPCPVPVR